MRREQERELVALKIFLSLQEVEKEIVIDAFGNELQKKMNSFRPELVLISAGFDSRKEIPLGNSN